MKLFLKQYRPLALTRRAPIALLFIASLFLLAALVIALWPSDKPIQTIEQAHPTGWQQSGAVNPFGKTGQASASQSQPEGASAPALLSIASTSLAGTQPDGSWTVNAQGQLLPSRAIRQRFDYYLSLIGELPQADLRALLLQDAKQNLKEPAFGQAIALWDKYVNVQQHAWKHAVDLRQPSTWSAALSERQIVRREKLGADVAHAFYAEEDSALQGMISRVNSGVNVSAGAGQATAAQAEPVIPQSLHPQAQEREAQLAAQWQAWDERLAAARRQIQAYSQAPELSPQQRSQAIESYLNQQFQGSELIRARSLLGF